MKSRLLKVENYLRNEPRARERYNRYKTIRNLILKEFPNLTDISKDKIEEIAFQAVHFSRCIQRAQQLNRDLRGLDYEDKKNELEQKVMIKLEYLPGQNQDNKKLKLL